MKSLRVTLRADGPADDMLAPIVRWVLEQHLPTVPIDDEFAKWFGYGGSKEKGLAASIRYSLELAPCDLLVVHRDAEGARVQKRFDEIDAAIEELREQKIAVPHVVRLVPVRMSEAWLLFDEAAIRTAAGNPNGKVELRLPSHKQAEAMAEAKTKLSELLATASEAKGRRRQRFYTSGLQRAVARNIEDFSPLRGQLAFQEFEAEIEAFAATWQPDE